MAENNLEKSAEVPVQTVEKSEGFNGEFLKSILDLEKECFPEEWQYPDAEEYYREMLEDRENVNIFLKENKKIIGYILGKPFSKAMEYLKEYDSDLREDDTKFYVETIQISPEARSRGGSRKLLNAICEEVFKKGIRKFAIHARTTNNFHDKMKKMFEGKVNLVRKIDKWKPANGESYEYIEWEYEK